MENQMHNHTLNDDSKKFYRFQVFQGETGDGSKITKTKSVGMAYLKDGQNIFTLRLWTFSWDRYYILPNKNDSSKFLVMTREPNRNPAAKNKFFWNIVGNGVADSALGVIRIEFDLLSKPFYMNIHPESSAYSVSLPDPEAMPEAA